MPPAANQAFDDPPDDMPYGDLWDGDVVCPHVEVEIGGPEIVGVILGPDGEPLHTVLDRERFPFGFNLT